MSQMPTAEDELQALQWRAETAERRLAGMAQQLTDANRRIEGLASARLCAEFARCDNEKRILLAALRPVGELILAAPREVVFASDGPIARMVLAALNPANRPAENQLGGPK